MLLLPLPAPGPRLDQGLFDSRAMSFFCFDLFIINIIVVA